MATIQQSIVSITTAFADPAAAPSEADMPKQWNLPDLTDAIGILMPFAGTIVGISVQGNLAAGDTLKVIPKVGGTTPQMAGGADANSLGTTITNAAPGASTIVTKDQADAQFAANTYVSLRYITTTAGTYTVNDIVVTLFISTGREDL